MNEQKVLIEVTLSADADPEEIILDHPDFDLEWRLPAKAPDELVDLHLDAVLRAAGSALRHYTMPKSLADMRAAMREAMAAAPAA